MNKIRILFSKAFWRICSPVFNISTIISPEINTRLRYRLANKKKLNLANPKTFKEKLLWIKLNKYNHDPLVIECSDKYLVRNYVRECGCEESLNELIGAWDSSEDIPWDELPPKFALKWNFGAGMNIICQDKSKLDRDEVVEQMNKWKKNKCWLSHSELHYKYIPKKIICEKFLESGDEEVVPDYKIYCFHGEPKAIFVMHDRGVGEIKTEFFDTNWTKLDNTSKYSSPQNPTQRPPCLDVLLDMASKLSKPFPFVRCDFYVIGEKVYFGELTFTPAAGIYVSETKIDGKDMSEYLHLDKI